MQIHINFFLYFKVNEHLKDIMEQEQKSKEHHTAEAPGGQKVHTAVWSGYDGQSYMLEMRELF